MARHAERRKVLDEVARLGGTVEWTRGDHLRINTPQGPYFTGKTPGDFRWVKKITSDLRKMGWPDFLKPKREAKSRG